MGKIIFERDKCFGCGACCTIAKKNFTFDDDGKATMISDKLTDEAKLASNACPTKAIKIEENNENCNCNDKCNCNEDCNCNDDDCCCEECNCESNCTCEDNCECTEECNCGCKN